MRTTISPLLELSLTLLAALQISVSGQLVINEVDADQAGSDTSEFIELYDGGPGNMSLDGFVLVLFNGNTDTVYRAFDLNGHATNPQGFFVIGNPGVPNVDLVVDPGASGALQNGPDAIALYRGAADAFPNGASVSKEGLIDALVYGTDDSDDFELLDALTPGEIQVNDTPDESMSRIPDGGSPFASAAFALQTPTPGLPNVISESLSLSLSTQEFLESAGSQAVEVTVIRSGSTASETVVTVEIDDFTEVLGPNEITIAAGSAETVFFVAAVDDAWADGTQTAELVATSVGLKEARATLHIHDDPEDPLGVIVNEVYADDREDANGDGEGLLDGPGKDEFVELINAAAEPIDLSGHTLRDGVAIRHTFPEGSVIDPGCAAVIFGGGDLVEGKHPLFGGTQVQMANGSNAFGLGLDNSGDFVRVLDSSGIEVAGFRYGSADGQAGSLVRNPDVTGDMVPHLEVEDGPALFSFTPGFTVTGEPFCEVMLELHLRIEPLIISEDAGEEAAILTISRTGPLHDSLLVTLSNSDASQLQVQETVEIPEGAASLDVSIHAVDNQVDDGDVLVSLTASAPGHVNGMAQIQVLDDGDPPAMIVINELDADQAGEENREFVELYDGGLGNVPLDGLVVVLFNGATGGSYAAYALRGQTTNASGFFVLGDEDVPNVNLAIPNFTLQNGPDGVALYRGTRSDFPQGSFPLTDNLVDAVVYGTNDDDAIDLIAMLTPGQTQVNEGAADNAHSIGRVADGGEPRQTDSYATLNPTPGTGNESAPQIPQPGYASWAAGFDHLGAQDEDPDGDGWPNLLEYALGTDPQSWTRAPALILTPLGKNGAVAVDLPLVNGLPAEISIHFERSTDLVAWVPAVPEETQFAEGIFRAAFSDFLTSGAMSFMRLGIAIEP